MDKTKTDFDVAQEGQLLSRNVAPYYPVAKSLQAESEVAYSLRYRSQGMASLATSYRDHVTPITYLHSSAKMMLLDGQENGMHAAHLPSSDRAAPTYS